MKSGSLGGVREFEVEVPFGSEVVCEVNRSSQLTAPASSAFWRSSLKTVNSAAYLARIFEVAGEDEKEKRGKQRTGCRLGKGVVT